MQIYLNITFADINREDDILTLQVFPEMTIDTLRGSVQAEKQIPPSVQHIFLNGQPITDGSKTMEELHISNEQMLAIHVRDTTSEPGPSPPGRASAAVSLRNDSEVLRLRILGDPRLREATAQQHPQLVAVLDDPVEFARRFESFLNTERHARLDREREIAELNADPFNVENQARIEEMIRQEQVMENLQSAMEHNPEAFGIVHMLYIDIEVNGHKVKALVDSGAQATIMSPQCAEACGMMRLVDQRFSGIARGVGTANILGRVHGAQVKIGSVFLPCSFTVMEGKTVDFLLGLDMLKRHQACIDLARGCLCIQGIEVPFLAEHDSPSGAGNNDPELMVPGPAGTAISQRSGAVVPVAPNASSETAPAATTTASTTTNTALSQSSQQQPSTTSSQPQQNPQPSSSSSSPFSEADIQKLIQLGFTRDAAIRALEATDGQVEYAAGLLFQDQL